MLDQYMTLLQDSSSSGGLTPDEAQALLDSFARVMNNDTADYVSDQTLSTSIDTMDDLIQMTLYGANSTSLDST